jgi:hypothetical protein
MKLNTATPAARNQYFSGGGFMVSENRPEVLLTASSARSLDLLILKKPLPLANLLSFDSGKKNGWLGDVDSNHGKQIQSLLSYH